jgi:hypothetical protein
MNNNTLYNCSDYDVTNIEETVTFSVLVIINILIAGYISISLIVISKWGREHNDSSNLLICINTIALF